MYIFAFGLYKVEAIVIYFFRMYQIVNKVLLYS